MNQDDFFRTDRHSVVINMLEGESSSSVATIAPTATAAAVSLKLPPYWKQNPAAWFTFAESSFNLRNITVSRTKYDYVVTSLPCELFSEISDILASPDANDPYTFLKDTLISRTSMSERERLRQLLSKEDLGDRKPSQLLRHMQSLLGDTERTFDMKLLRELFTQRLPANVQQVLAATSTDTNIDSLAQIADRVLEVNSNTVYAVSKPLDVTSNENPFEKQIATLTELVADLALQVKELKGERSRSRSSNRNRYQKNNTSNSGMCFYHSKYGKKAIKCVSPCTYKGNSQSE